MELVNTDLGVCLPDLNTHTHTMCGCACVRVLSMHGHVISIITQSTQWQYLKLTVAFLPNILRLDSSIGAEHVRKIEEYVLLMNILENAPSKLNDLFS